MKIRATIVLAYLREIGQNETPACTLQCEVAPEDVSKIDTNVVYADLWLTEKAIERSLKAIHDATGVEVTDWATDLVELQDKPVVLVMEQESYNGKTSWKVKFVNNPSRSREADPALVDSLNAKLRSMGIAKRAAAAKPAPTPTDDLPF